MCTLLLTIYFSSTISLLYYLKSTTVTTILLFSPDKLFLASYNNMTLNCLLFGYLEIRMVYSLLL